MRAIGWSTVLSAGLALGCREAPAPTEARVTIESELVERVCRGTIAHAESELARIEAELELAPMSEQVEIHVIDPERIGEFCEPGKQLCVLQPPRAIYVSAEVYNRVLTRELVRDRLARSAVGSTKPMFSEGVATALTQPRCWPYPHLWEPPTANQILSKTLGTSLNEDELYLAGELLRWLLDTRGPSAVLDFMATLDRSDSPDEVRVAYLERFGSAIDLDLYAHWRPADQTLEPERAGCVGPEPPRDPSRSRILLEASFDCSSPVARNDFTNPGRTFVEWTLTIDESTAGTYHLDGALPDDVYLTISACECRYQGSLTELPPNQTNLWDDEFDPRWGERLAPGVYRLRAYGPIGASLDFEIVTPCDFALQNCPTGEQCTPDGRCNDEVEDPGQHGDACWPTFLADQDVLPCDAGLICIGPFDQEGVCLPHCGEEIGTNCPDDLSCEALSACTSTCDPFTSGCEEGWSCVTDFETGIGGCYPYPNTNLGLLESCWQFDFKCAPGLWCENLPLDGCHDPEAWIDFSGCCTPLCDPAAPDPGCPPELPNCEADEGDALGICLP